MEKRIIYVIRRQEQESDVNKQQQLYELLVDYIENHRDAPESNYFFATSQSGKGSISYPHISLTLRRLHRGWNKEAGDLPYVKAPFASALVKRKWGLWRFKSFRAFKPDGYIHLHPHQHGGPIRSGEYTELRGEEGHGAYRMQGTGI